MKHDHHNNALPVWKGRPGQMIPISRPPRIPRAILCILLAASVGIALLLLTGCNTTRNSTPPGDMIGLPAYTASMRPALRGDEFTLIRRVPFESIKVGDVIVYRAHWHPTLVAHRVIQSGRGRLVTKGDNNPAPDPGFVTRSTFVGLLTHIDGRPIQPLAQFQP